MSPNHHHHQQIGPHVQNIFVDPFPPSAIHTSPNNFRQCSQAPISFLVADSSVNYFVPNSAIQSQHHSFGRHQNCSSAPNESANLSEEQICWRSLLRICILGIFLVIFVFIVYKVIENEVTQRIMDRQKGASLDH